MFYIITNTRKDNIMSSMPICDDDLRKLLENQTPFSNLHPNYVADPEVDRILYCLRNISIMAFYLQKTYTIAIEEEEEVDTPINRDVIKAFYEMALTMLKPEQISGLNRAPSFPSPSSETVSDDAYNHVHRLHFAYQNWEPLSS